MFGMMGIGAIKLFPTAAYTTTTAGLAGVDLQGYVPPGANCLLKALVSVGTLQTASSIAVKMQQNLTTSAGGDGGWTDILTPTTAAISTISGTVGADSEIHFTTPARYVRAVITVGTTATSIPVAAFILAEKRVQ